MKRFGSVLVVLGLVVLFGSPAPGKAASWRWRARCNSRCSCQPPRTLDDCSISPMPVPETTTACRGTADIGTSLAMDSTEQRAPRLAPPEPSDAEGTGPVVIVQVEAQQAGGGR
ncbi:MAG: hypothetical protein ACLQNE_31140 [Thermoguttaceae bacterium]